jgi:predicted kinase
MHPPATAFGTMQRPKSGVVFMWRFPFTPTAPSYSVDWAAIRGAFNWVRAMAGVQQEPQWHAEGDVAIHTRMVTEAMAADADWQAADELTRNALFCAALLHDVAKPQCTRNVDGQWTSPNHARVGEKSARRLMYQGLVGDVPPFEQREIIAKLVRFHGLPLRFIDKINPARVCIEASLQVNLKLVALLARADVIGQECKDKQRLMDTIELFLHFCGELECLDAPRQFASDYHRFVYCVGGKPIDYVPFDATRCEATLMSGLPAAGKSAWIAKHGGGQTVISLDEMREDLGVDPGDDDQSPVINLAKERSKDLLRRNASFIWDATNVSKDLRGALVALFANYGARVRIVYVESPWRQLLAQNRARKRVVPESVMERLLGKLEIPTVLEASTVTYVA